jgi:RNA polymerase sigma-70 factor (ECF subfamily)
MRRDVPTRPSLLLRVRDPEDEAAWSQFVAIYTPLIFAFCRGRGLMEADAADVTQEVLKAVAVAVPRFEYDPERSSFRNWLFTVVRSKLNNFITAQARRPQPAGDTALQQFINLTADGSAEETWRQEYQSHLLRWAATQIRPEFKEATWDAFWRTAVLGEEAERVAAALGLSLNAIYIARSRVTSRLKQTIDALGDSGDVAQGFAHA